MISRLCARLADPISVSCALIASLTTTMTNQRHNRRRVHHLLAGSDLVLIYRGTLVSGVCGSSGTCVHKASLSTHTHQVITKLIQLGSQVPASVTY